MAGFAPVEPHGELELLFPDLWRVVGSVVMLPLTRISRNMAVLRHEGALMLVNAVRLDEAGLAALDALGRVEHVVRIGVHKMDDAFYVDRYGARSWCPAGFARDGQSALRPDELPFPGLRLFEFEHTRDPEAALLVEREGGILLTCDSVQHWEPMRFSTLPARLASEVMGFEHPAQIGPPWKQRMTPAGSSLRPDFERMAALPFRHLLGAHGGLLRDRGPELLRESITRNYGA